MIKKFLLMSMLLVASSIGIAQEKVAGADVIKKFFETKTCVVLDNNIFNSYNSGIKKAVESSWKLTEFEYITQDEFKARRKNPKYSFLLMTKDFYKDDSDRMTYAFLSLLLGGNFDSVDKMPTLASFPLSYWENQDYEKYVYKLTPIVKFMQNHVNLTKEHPELTEKNIILYYNKNVEKLGDKKLYIIKEDLPKDLKTPAKVKECYSKPFEILEEPDELETIIKNQDEKTVFVHKVGPPKGSPKVARCICLVLGVDGSVYYTDYHKINAKNPDGFLKTDFKKLSKQ
ncbi:MAG: hypothetical protein MJ211_03140 [Bacteroidales bacterium]|nr:hypothetical protein [Bacteroidales bacterium]